MTMFQFLISSWFFKRLFVDKIQNEEMKSKSNLIKPNLPDAGYIKSTKCFFCSAIDVCLHDFVIFYLYTQHFVFTFKCEFVTTLKSNKKKQNVVSRHLKVKPVSRFV